MSGLRKWLFQPRFNYTDLLDQQRARALLLVCGVLGSAAILGNLYILLTLTLDLSTYATLASLSAIFLFCVATYGLVQRGRLRLGSLLIVGVLIVGVDIVVVPYGLDNFLILTLSVPLCLAGALFQRRGVALTFLALIISMGLMALIVDSQLIMIAPAYAPGTETLATLVIGGLLLAVDAGILWAFTGAQNDLLQRTTGALHDLRATTAISQTVSSYFSSDELLSQTVESVRDRFGYYHVQVFLVEENSRLIVRRARTGLVGAPTQPERRIPTDETQNVVVEVIRSGQLTRVTQVSPRARRTEFLPATQSEALLPLRVGAQTLGVLDVQSAQLEAFSTSEVEVLEAIASQLAIALQSIQRSTQLQVTLTERQRLQEQNMRLARDVERLGKEVAGRSWVRYLANRSQDVLGFDWKRGQTASNATLTPTLTHAFQNALPEVHTEQDEQVLSVPILSRGQTLGVMEFRAPGSVPWNNRSIELARIIAQRLALSLDNLRLFEQAQLTANREQTINQVTARLQAKTDLDALLSTAAEAFSQALGATHTSIQLGLPDQIAGQKDGR